MANSPMHLIRRFAEFQPAEKVAEMPTKRRGIYVLYKQRKKAGKLHYDVVYVGMTTAGMKGRLKQHLKSERKKDLWSHFSAYEVYENVKEDEIRELEGLFRHVYRKDSRANKLNRQKKYAKVERVRKDDFTQWT
jgi:hypothetical protein